MQYVYNVQLYIVVDVIPQLKVFIFYDCVDYVVYVCYCCILCYVRNFITTIFYYKIMTYTMYMCIIMLYKSV